MPKAKKGQMILDCGCVRDTSQWLKLCETHRQEFNGIHMRWRDEKLAAAMPIDCPSPTKE